MVSSVRCVAISGAAGRLRPRCSREFSTTPMMRVPTITAIKIVVEGIVSAVLRAKGSDAQKPMNAVVPAVSARHRTVRFTPVFSEVWTTSSTSHR